MTSGIRKVRVLDEVSKHVSDMEFGRNSGSALVIGDLERLLFSHCSENWVCNVSGALFHAVALFGGDFHFIIAAGG